MHDLPVDMWREETDANQEQWAHNFESTFLLPVEICFWRALMEKVCLLNCFTILLRSVRGRATQEQTVAALFRVKNSEGSIHVCGKEPLWQILSSMCFRASKCMNWLGVQKVFLRFRFFFTFANISGF